MSILNKIINIKKKSITNEKVIILMDYVKSKIIEQVKQSIDGAEKKQNVDTAVISFINTTFTSKNLIIKMLINILVDYVPVLTQCIYEYLKKYVDGLTEV